MSLRPATARVRRRLPLGTPADRASRQSGPRPQQAASGRLAAGASQPPPARPLAADAARPMAPPAEGAGAICPICLDLLESGSRVISLAPCGHILHRACYDRCAAAAAAGLGGRPGAPRCPMCRGSVAEDRIKSASAVPGARLAGGYAQYAARSAAPPPPPRDLCRAALASMGPVPAPAGGGLRQATGAPAATNIPASAQDQLLAGIMAQLGAAAPAPSPLPTAAPQPFVTLPGESAGQALLRMLRLDLEGQAARRAQQTTTAAAAAHLAPAAVPAAPAVAAPPAAACPSTWCFSIDVSSSMGNSQDWQPGAVSRLCFALASLVRLGLAWAGRAKQTAGLRLSSTVGAQYWVGCSPPPPSLSPSLPQACVVDAKVAPGDWVTVQAFDAEQATLKPWFRKPGGWAARMRRATEGHLLMDSWQQLSGSGEGGPTCSCCAVSCPAPCASTQLPCIDVQLAPPSFLHPAPAAAFNKAAFLAELTGAVRACGLRCFGTRTYAAAKLAVETLAAKANSLAVPQQVPAGGGSGAAAQQGSPAHVGAAPAELGAATHSLVLLTDGWADDLLIGYESAAELMLDPPFVSGGFKALLVRGRWSRGAGVEGLE